MLLGAFLCFAISCRSENALSSLFSLIYALVLLRVKGSQDCSGSSFREYSEMNKFLEDLYFPPSSPAVPLEKTLGRS